MIVITKWCLWPIPDTQGYVDNNDPNKKRVLFIHSTVCLLDPFDRQNYDLTFIVVVVLVMIYISQCIVKAMVKAIRHRYFFSWIIFTVFLLELFRISRPSQGEKKLYKRRNLNRHILKWGPQHPLLR